MRPSTAERISTDRHAPVFIRDADQAMAQIIRIVSPIVSASELDLLSRADRWIRGLFAGEFPGVRACNTPYHDLNHTYAVALAMARALVGDHVRNGSSTVAPLNPHEVFLGVVAALFHDTGYLQDAGDTAGTGAKYTVGHEQRSAGRARQFLREHGFGRPDQLRCAAAITHGPPSDDHADGDRLGELLTYADLYSQMADRSYVEKLLYLYREFHEAAIPGYHHERDVLSGTRTFYRHVTSGPAERVAQEVSELLADYFEHDTGERTDLYGSYISRNIAYLDTLIAEHWDSYRRYLRRDDVIHSLEGFTTA